MENRCIEPGVEEEQAESSHLGGHTEAGPGGIGKSCSARRAQDGVPGNKNRGMCKSICIQGLFKTKM